MPRLSYGITLGFFAWLTMMLADALGLSSHHWLRKQALLACCRIGGLGGGIDEGAGALMEEWGNSVKPLLHEMRCKNQIPRSALHGAYVHDDIYHEICAQWKKGSPAEGVAHKFLEEVIIQSGYFNGKQARLVGLHQCKPTPVFEAKTFDGDLFFIRVGEFRSGREHA